MSGKDAKKKAAAEQPQANPRALRRGCLYSARYRRYRVDPRPLLLVLWSDAEKVHAINLNYLDSSKLDETASFVARHLQTVLTNYDARAFYRKYVRRQMAGSVGEAYRTYFARELRNLREISSNPLQSITALRGLWRSRSEKEDRGAEPASYANPTPSAVSVGPAKGAEAVSDYVDMLAAVSPKRGKGGLFSRLFGRKG